MKTEQEVREAIGDYSITRIIGSNKGEPLYADILSNEEVQDLAVIIGKALGIVDIGRKCENCKQYTAQRCRGNHTPCPNHEFAEV